MRCYVFLNDGANVCVFFELSKENGKKNIFQPLTGRCILFFLFRLPCSAYGIRTRVPGVRGRYPRPLDESAIGAKRFPSPAPLRKLGDSNPRYGNPYGSLANCWFQPLTQTSKRRFRLRLNLFCGCKDRTTFCFPQQKREKNSV